MMSVVLALLTLLLVLPLYCARDPPQPPTRGAIETGVYRNVFAEAGYAPAEITQRLTAIYTQLFDGDPNNQAILYPAQDPTVNASYVEDIYNNDVRTEGMSYGLMWTVQLNMQTRFDRIFRWYRVYMRHPAGDIRAGYSSWHCKTSGAVLDANAASDGETWIVTALIFAARRWGNSGAINYTAEAEFVLTNMLNKEDPPCGREGCSGVVNMFGGALPIDTDPPIVRFVPEGGAATYTDASYHLPAYYEQWAISTQRTAYWRQAANTSRSFFRVGTNPVTGLAPNQADFNGKPHVGGTTFSYDAWRVARNIAMDLAWYATDYTWQVGFCNRLLAFFRGQKTWPKYGSEFTLNGTQTNPNHSPGLVGMNAVCALASNDIIAWDFVDALWNMSTPSGGGRYYDGALYLEAWLHLSGNFRASWSKDAEGSISYDI